VFTLRETKPSWQTQPLLTANQVAESIAQRIDIAHPLYSSRLASFVSEISVRSPSQLRIRFSRVPLSIESLLRFPATRSVPPGGDQAAAASASGTTAVIATRFQQKTAAGNAASWLRGVPEPDGLDAGKYHVAEIQEQRFDDRNRMIQAFNRGDIDYIPKLLPWEVDAFLASDFQVKKYALPMTHVLIFNPRSERITNAQTRRALSFAINREGILRSTILRDESMKHGRPTSAAWHLRSYATEPREPAPRFNLRLAYALRFAAEQQLRIAELMKLTEAAKEKARVDKINFDPEQFRRKTKVDYVKLPRLRFVVEPGEVPKAAAERLLSYWTRIGFEIDVIQGDQPGKPLSDSDWDFCYRQVRMEEPLLELWPVLANDTTFDMSRLGLYPDWMRQELVGLDYASSFLDAQEKLFTIHRHIAAQAFLIPLWEVDEYAVLRKNVSGIPAQLMSVYHNAERWMIKP
jgi:ABC-type transport system substrate-binding protein